MSQETRREPAERRRCATCQRERAEGELGELSPCAICKRPVCAACLGPYGHHMLACEECRLAPW